MEFGVAVLLRGLAFSLLVYSVTASTYNCTRQYRGYCVIENVTSEAIERNNFPEHPSILIQNGTVPVFGADQFARIPHVENLMLHHLQVEQLELANCMQLGTLFASYNDISSVSAKEGLPLRSLHLYQNLLKNISGLRPLVNLEQLYLNDNLIEILEMDVFAAMKSLKILTLHRNLLKAIDTRQALSLPSLESLFMQVNKLTYLDTSLWKMPALQRLDLSANSFGFLFTFLEEFPALSVLELHTNRWNCAWLHQMMQRVQDRSIQVTQTDRSCGEEGTALDNICCFQEGASPDPMMLLISRAAIVDDLQDEIAAQRNRVQTLEEAQRKQTYKFDQMKEKIERIEKFCRNEL